MLLSSFASDSQNYRVQLKLVHAHMGRPRYRPSGTVSAAVGRLHGPKELGASR
jgi:hypothetical protein